MAVAIAKQTTPAGVAGSGNTVTYTAAPIGTASNDRMVVVAPTSEDATAAAVTKVTLDGVALAQITSAQFGAMNASLWWGNFGTGTTAEIVVTYTSTAPIANNNRISIFAVTGAEPSLSTFTSDTSTDMDVTSPLSAATTVPASGAVIGVACGAASSSAAKAWGGNITEAEEVATSTYCHTSATGTTSGATTITVTGGTNNEDGALAVAVFATASGKPQNRQTNWPNPIPARRPTEFLDWFNPGLDIRSIIPEDTTNLPSVVSDWGPPPSAAARSNALSTWINPGIRVVAAVQDPFSETDWPNPRGFATRNGTWITPSRDLAPPFVPPSWPNPRGFATKDGTWINPGFKDAVVVGAPFRQTDWVNPKGHAPRSGYIFQTPQGIHDLNVYMPSVALDWYTPPAKPQTLSYILPRNLPLNSVVAAAPFNQLDWPNPRAAKRSIDLLTWINGLPPIQFVTRGPLVNRYNRQSWHVALSSQPRANLLPLVTPVVAAPFKQTDWLNPKTTRQTPSVTPSSNLPLNTVAAPFKQTDWLNPKRVTPRDGTWITPSRDLAPPFVPKTWPNPRAAQRSTDLTWISSPHVLQRPNTKPFDQSSWPVPTPRAPQPLSYTLPGGLPLNSVVVAAPFAQYNWPVPGLPGRQPQSFTIPTGLPLASLPGPSRQTDWPNPRQPGRPLSFTNSQNLPLNTVEAAPFKQTDWSNPRSAQRSLGLSTWTNPGLPDTPFNQLDWPNPRAAQRSTDLLSWLSSPHVLQRPNIQPFNKSDWTVPAGRAPLPQSFTISYSLPLNTPVGPKPFTQLDWPNPTWPTLPNGQRILIGQSQILSIPPEPEPEPDFPPHEPPTDSGGAGIKSGVWKPGKRANYRSYRYITEKEIEQLTGTEIRQSARDLRADVRKDPFAEEVDKEILALSRIVNQLADIDRLEKSVAELSRAIEYARKARAEAEEDEEIAILLLSQ